MMRRLTTLATLVAVAALVLASAAGGATKTIDVDDNFFDPEKKRIKKGDRLAFDWVGTEEHTVTKAKGPGPNFDSGTLQGEGVLYKRKFKKRGDYKLFCRLHPEMKMKVVVK